MTVMGAGHSTTRLRRTGMTQLDGQAPADTRGPVGGPERSIVNDRHGRPV